MTVDVHPATDAPDDDTAPATGPSPAHAAPGSPLINLRAQRQAKIDALHLDLEVPRWSETGPAHVWIRYRPADMTVALTAPDKRRAQGRPNWLELATADILVDACVGVYTKVDGTAYTLNGDGQWVRFDPDRAHSDEWVSVSGTRAPELAAALGLEAKSAVEVLRALFFSSGDLMAHSGELNDFSSRAAPKADEEFLGE